jgi:hypothetical protein
VVLPGLSWGFAAGFNVTVPCDRLAMSDRFFGKGFKSSSL